MEFLKITGTTEENAENLPKNYIKDTLEPLRGVMRARYKDGLWMSAEGAVYDVFNQKAHVIDNFSIPWWWRRIISMDFGFQHPLVVHWWAYNPEKTQWIMYREIYQAHLLVEDAARLILRHSGKERTLRESKGEQISAVYCDWDKEDSATLARYGVPSKEAKKGPNSVSAGIQMIYHLMATDRIRFFRNARVNSPCPFLKQTNHPLSTIEEIPRYRYAKPDLPQKLYDDGCDAMRYAIYSDELMRSSWGITPGPLPELENAHPQIRQR